MQKNLKGELSICKGSSNQEPYRYISVELRDTLSGTRVISVTFNSMEEFVQALFSGTGECIYDFNAINVGKTREHKEEIVFIPDHPYSGEEKDKIIREALKPYEMHGWHGSDYAASNHHNRLTYKELSKLKLENKEGHWMKIGFVRYV